MRAATILVGLLIGAAGANWEGGPRAADPPAPPAWAPKFKVQEIDTGLKIGYAVITADLNGDGKPDIVVVNNGDATVTVMLNTTTP